MQRIEDLIVKHKIPTKAQIFLAKVIDADTKVDMRKLEAVVLSLQE